MKPLLICVLVGACLLVPAMPILGQGFVVDHRHVDLFDQIPESYLTAARNLRVVFSDRSVGQNINEYLGCLTAAGWSTSSSSCRRDYYDQNWNWRTFTPTDFNAGLVPERILFEPDPTRYSRANWTFEYRAGSWSDLTRDFIESLAPAYLDSKDVLTYQFSYLNVDESSDIANPQTGFFTNNPSRYDIYDLEQFIAQHPDKVFFFWTSSLARGIGTGAAMNFNDQMRAYCQANGRILFDMADIEAHTHLNIPCYDNRDGVAYVSMTGATENHPDDGHDYPAICQDWTTETDGGHLGSVSGGGIRVVKAMWVLMARIAGWNPDQPARADFDRDGDADLDDLAIFEACATGPAIAYDAANLASGCDVTPDPADHIPPDFDEDGDVDQSDFALFQRCFSGEDQPVPPDCAS